MSLKRTPIHELFARPSSSDDKRSIGNGGSGAAASRTSSASTRQDDSAPAGSAYVSAAAGHSISSAAAQSHAKALSSSSSISMSPPVLLPTRTTKHMSLTIQPTDDPFAPYGPAPLGEEEWERVSEELMLAEAQNGKPSSPTFKVARRRPSFLRGFIKSRRTSIASLVSTSDISSPILSPAQAMGAGERSAALRTSASLMSLRNAVGGEKKEVNRDSYTSGSSSLGMRPQSGGQSAASISSSGGGAGDASPNAVVRPGSSRGSVKLFDALRRRTPTPPSPSHIEFPKTEVDNTKIISKNGVERIGVRTSVYTEEDRLAGLGLALTTDAPTRRVVPDNARLSIFSATTADRSTLYSSIGSEPGGGARERVGSAFSQGPSVYDVAEEDEHYDPGNEDIEVVSIRRNSLAVPDSSTPPVPPMPVEFEASPSPKSVPHSRSATLATLDSSTTSAAIRDHNFRMLARRTRGDISSSPPTSPDVKSLYTASGRLNAPGRAEAIPDLGPLGLRHGIGTVPRSPLSSSAPNTPTIKPLATMYIVAGLPKDPATWALTDHSDPTMPAPDHAINAVPRFWRPEVLGCMTTNDESSAALDSLDGSSTHGKGRASLASARAKSEPQPEFVALSREEITKIQAKATKLGFPRDVEILASTTQPPATISHFAFTVQTSAKFTDKPMFAGSAAAAWDTTLSRRAIASSAIETTYYASCLIVWSHPDTVRSDAIRMTLHGGAQAKNLAVSRGVRAARSGKKLGAKLQRQLASPMGAVVTEGREWSRSGNETDTTEFDTDGFVTESEWGESAATASPLADLPASLPLWLPYSLILVSHAPIYNVLSDTLRISWARYHQDIASHSLQMERVLHFPAPRVGEKIRLPVSVSTAQNTFFVATMPGIIDWKTGASLDQNFIMFPVFKCLHADNLLTIAEIALSPLGRVLFISSHAIMLSLATFTFQHILELRGWRGLVHASVAARDIKIYLEDPGPWLVGIPSLSRSIALMELTPEVVVVDLDSNAVNCERPQPGSITSGPMRDKARKRLEAAIGNVGAYFGVPSELVEAFPAGRFRPSCEVSVSGVVRDAEKIKPPSGWDWDQERVIQTFDAILAEQPRTGLGRFFNSKKPRKLAELDPSAKHVQAVVRKHAKTFVDRRDDLETKINKLNNKLASLMSESQEWQRSFDTFKAFSEKLTKESVDLKTRLEKERREARRLTGTLSVEKKRQADLEASLQATERAREQALLELSNVQAIRDDLERQQTMLMTEMHSILATDGEASALIETVYARIEALSSRSDSSSRPGTSQSVRGYRSRRPGSSEGGSTTLAPTEEETIDEERVTENTGTSEVDEEEKLEAMRAAVQETLRSIQSRLQIVLQNAKSIRRPSEERRQSSELISFGDSAIGDSDPRRISITSNASTTRDNGEDETVTFVGRRSTGGSMSPLPPPAGPLPETPTEVRYSIVSTAESESAASFRTAREPNSGVKYREPRRFQPKPFSLTASPTFTASPDLRSVSPYSEADRSYSSLRGAINRRQTHAANESIMSNASFYDAPEGTDPLSSPLPGGLVSMSDLCPTSDESGRMEMLRQSAQFDPAAAEAIGRLTRQASHHSFGPNDRLPSSRNASYIAEDSADNDDSASFVSVSESLGGDRTPSPPPTPDPIERVMSPLGSRREFLVPANGEIVATPPVELFTRAKSPPMRVQRRTESGEIEVRADGSFGKRGIRRG